MPHAFILGGTGQIGLALGTRLLADGWTVALAQRGPHAPPADLLARGAKLVRLDRAQPGVVAHAIGQGADLLIDAVAFGPEHAAQLLEIEAAVGGLVVISSSSVYRDALGRSLDEAAETGFPVLPVPVGEGQSTVEPGPATYSTRKVAMERVLLDGARGPLTILRPAAIHGIGSKHPREWWFVKRMRDRRPVISLAYGGESRFHTTGSANIAAAVMAVSGRRGSRILNVADAEALTVAEIGALIARHMAYEGEIVCLPKVDRYPPPRGRTPWSTQHPFVLDISALRALARQPVADYAGSVASICDWLVSVTDQSDWRALFPVLAAYPYELFDDAE